MYAWLWQYVKKYRMPMAFGFLLSVGVSALSLVNPVVAGRLVDDVIGKGDIGLLWWLLGIMIATVLVKAGLRFAYQMLFEHASQSIIRRIREGLYQKLQAMDFGYFDRTKTGDIMSQMTSDIDAVRHFLAWVTYQVFENGLVFVVSIVVLFFLNWQLALLLLAVTPVIGFFAFKLARSVKPTFARVREQVSRINSIVQENIAGNRVVKAFAREAYEIRKFEKENDEFRARNLESARVWGTYIPLIEFSSALLQVILILAGGLMIISGNLTLGTLVTFNSLIWALNNPLRMSGWLVNDIQRFAASCERLYKLEQTPSKLENAPGARTIERLKGKVEFRDVRFSYGDEPVLDNINFTVEAGQTVGIMGPTGSGKSSLVKLICRYYDRSAGEILLDGIDLSSIDLHSLRSNVGITMQDVFLFSDTIEGNIAFGVPDAPMDKVVHASTLANSHEFVKNLSEGYDTIVGERGVGLSGGQRQRVTLARLLLKDPPIMILDDTTSAVDIETEERIQHSIRSLHGSRTMFIVAHRVSSIMHADVILVLKDGTIIERGTHRDLVALEGYYAEVFRHQIGVEHGAK